MKKFLLLLVAVAALAAPTAVLACDGSHHHFGVRAAFFTLRSGDRGGDFNGLFAKLSGSGSSFGDASSTATGSIVAGNTFAQQPSNCDTPLTSGGGNVESGTDCGFTSSGDLQNADPQLPTAPDQRGRPTSTRSP